VIATPKPPSDAWNVLRLVVEHPGELDAEAIGQRLWKPELSSTADYLRVRASILSGGPKWTAQAARCLHRLQGAGFIERVRPPIPAADPLTPIASMHKAAAWARDTLEAADLPWETPTGTTRTHALLVSLVRDVPPTVREWVGAAPNGATQRAVQALVEAGVVVPPSFRWPTPRGVALIEGAS